MGKKGVNMCMNAIKQHTVTIYKKHFCCHHFDPVIYRQFSAVILLDLLASYRYFEVVLELVVTLML